MEFPKSLVVIITFMISSLAQDGVRYTSDCPAGTCLSITQCPPLLRLLVEGRAHPHVADMLRKASCGFQGSDPLVCCEVATAPAPTLPTPALPLPTPALPHPAPPDCGFSNATMPRVVGGHPAKLGAWPWLVALGYTRASQRPTKRTKPKFLCAGSLITSRHVLTAGHCVASRMSTLYLARLGEHNLETNNDGASPIDIAVAKTKLHEDYNGISYVNDIALVWLSEQVKTTPMIRPICLPTSPELRSSTFLRSYPFIAGWGATSFRGPRSSALLQLQLPVVEQEACRRAYSEVRTAIIDDRVLCGGFAQGGKDACQGDSGGPVMWPQSDTDLYYVIGVVSYGLRCAEPGIPGVYTRVTAFLDWILRNLD